MDLDFWFVGFPCLGAKFFNEVRNLRLIEDCIAPWINELQTLRVTKLVPAGRRQRGQALAGVEDLLLRLAGFGIPGCVDSHKGRSVRPNV